MKTIAIPGMFYLPTTLMSSIFSTVFFNIESKASNLAVYKDIWIFFLLAVGLTFGTFSLWAWMSRTKATPITPSKQKMHDPATNAINGIKAEKSAEYAATGSWQPHAAGHQSKKRKKKRHPTS